MSDPSYPPMRPVGRPSATATPAPELPPELDPRRPQRPGHRRKRPRRPALRVLSWAAVVLSALTLVVSVGGYAVFNYYKGKLGTVNITGGPQPAAAADGSGQNYLLVGSDTRDFAGGQQFQAAKGSADYVTGQRSDTVMLAHIPGGKARATIVSFPRDSWVQIPAYTDPQGVQHDAHFAKLNAAFALGGPQLLVRTIEQLSGLHVDHYVQVDFAGFRNMVNALGGVNLCVGTTRHDHDSGDYLTAGTHHVTGDVALAFVRDRKGLPRGDIDRIADQQYFMAQMLKKVLSAGTLTNPFKINSFLNALTSSVTVDTDFGFSQMRTLAERFRHLDPAHVAMVTIPITTDAGWRDGQSVVLIDDAAAARMFDALKNDSSSSSPKPAAPPKVTVPPSQVHVVVLNGTARSGLALKTGNELAAMGFHVDRFGNAATHGIARTVVRYPADRADSAKTVAAAVPGAKLQEDDSATGVELTLGGDFTGTRAVGATAGGQSSSPASPAQQSGPPAQTAATVACAP